MLKFADVTFRVGTRRKVTRPKTILVLFLNWEKIFLEILEVDFFIFDLGFNS
jgi:hypothetical protein